MSQKNAPVKKNFTGAPPVHRWCGEIVKYLTLVRTHVGFAGDKSWTFRTDIGQMLDKDKVRTYTRRMLNKY